MKLTIVHEQTPVPPPAYHRAQVRLGPALHIDALTLVNTLHLLALCRLELSANLLHFKKLGPHCLLVYSSNMLSGKGGGRRGTGEDWIMEVDVVPYKRKLSSSRSS